MKKVLLTLLVMTALPVVAQTEVNMFNPGFGEGVTYTLPQTILNITVEAECITRTPGEFSRFADRFLRINDAISQEEKYWELTGVKLTTSGAPDPDKMYTIKLNNSSASNIVLNEDGIIESINCKIEKQEESQTTEQHAERIDAKQYMTEEILQATSTAKMAELTAKEIYAIRESKMAITRGTADNMPKDGLSMQLVLNELNTQEMALTQLFTGYVDTVKYTCNIKLTPAVQNNTEKNILFRFSRKLGILEKDNLAGKPIYYDFTSKNVIIPATDGKKIVKKEGICYNVPGRAQVRIYTPSETFFDKEVPIAQLGNVEILSKSLFNKNADTQVVFDTATGGIIRIDKE